MSESKRKLVTATEAAEELGVSRQAIHHHIHNSGVYVKSLGVAEDGRPSLYLVDIDELRAVVRPQVAIAELTKRNAELEMQLRDAVLPQAEPEVEA